MQKKVYIRYLSLDKILERLNKGEKLHDEDNHCYYQMKNSILIQFVDNKPDYFGSGFDFREDSDDRYFIDDVEEPEADESCIGKLCKFWGDDAINYEVGILKEIKNGQFCPKIGTRWYDRCQPLTKEEALNLIEE